MTRRHIWANITGNYFKISRLWRNKDANTEKKRNIILGITHFHRCHILSDPQLASENVIFKLFGSIAEIMPKVNSPTNSISKTSNLLKLISLLQEEKGIKFLDSCYLCREFLKIKKFLTICFNATDLQELINSENNFYTFPLVGGGGRNKHSWLSTRFIETVRQYYHYPSFTRFSTAGNNFTNS